MTGLRFLLVLLCLVLPAGAKPGKGPRQPHIAYVYPAGGQQGTTFRALVGGQFIRRVQEANFSGSGIEAKVVSTAQALPRLDREQRLVFRHRLKSRQAELNDQLPPKKPKALAEMESEPELPPHPLLDSINEMNKMELEELLNLFVRMRSKLAGNASLSQLVELEVTIAADAEPGKRDLRLTAPGRISNPLVFKVGTLPEHCVPPLPDGLSSKGTLEPIPLPAAVNSRILPGETRRIPVKVDYPMHLVVKVEARTLIPYLADAVPGWFQAVLRIIDPDGNELAFQDDTAFHPDPIWHGKLKKSGVYTVEIRDGIFRGREDFICRVEMGELPLALGLNPKGARLGTICQSDILGVNLPVTKVVLPTTPSPSRIRTVAIPGTSGQELPYVIEPFPECTAPPEPKPMQISPPVVINGALSKDPSWRDFHFEAEKGQSLVMEVMARRLGSPLDASLQILDPTGKCLKESDDFEQRDGHLILGPGLSTHHADPYLTWEAPAAGKYTVRIINLTGKTGPLHGFRLRISPPWPDFELALDPAQAVVRPGKGTPVELYVMRREGFNEAIHLSPAHPGFSCQPPILPPGTDHQRIRIVAAPHSPPQLVSLKILGTAQTESRTWSHQAVPTQDSMQAFLWRHLAPAREFLVGFPTSPSQEKPNPKSKP